MALRLLIADDSLTTRRVVRRALDLARMQVEITEAENGEVAWTLLGSQSFDVVLTDVHMPELNGIELIERMRADERLRSIPVIVVTSEAGFGRVAMLSRLGVRGYLRKPFTPEKVRDVLRDVVGDLEHEADQGAA
jgi:two-component system chemotaxis response regulator CheY